MARVRKPPSVLEWILCGAFFCLGLFVVFVWVFSNINGITAEKDLTLAQGVPEDATETMLSGRNGSKTYFVKFNVKEFHTEYSSDDAHYAEVLAAVKSEKPLKVWVSTKQETLLPRQGWVPLYKLESSGKTIVAYEDTVKTSKKGANAMLIVGLAITAIGAISLNTNRQNAKLKA